MSFLLSAGAVDVIPDGVADNFEEYLYEDKGNTLSDYYGGTLTNYARQQTTVLQGSYSLEITNGFNQPIWSTSGLPNYPAKGDIFAVTLNADGLTPEAYFGTPDSGQDGLNLGYGVRLDTNQSELNLVKRSGGSFNKLASTQATVNNREIDVEAEWHDGTGSQTDNTIIATFYDWDSSTETRGTEIDTLTATDSDFAGNTNIGFIQGRESTGTAQFDNYRIIGSV